MAKAFELQQAGKDGNLEIAARIQARAPEGFRIYAIGDVHGRVDLLSAKFQLIDAHKLSHPIERPIEVLLGDYIDRGPQSRAALDLIIKRTTVSEVFALAGNHEALLLGFLDDPRGLADWLRWGGKETMLSYGLRPPNTEDAVQLLEFARKIQNALPREHVDFVKNLPLSFACGDFLFVHAGLRPGVPIDLQKPDDLMWIRQDFLNYDGSFGPIIVHGHSPVRQPDIRPNRINIDTGAYITSKLTCLVIERDTIAFL